MDIKKNKIYGSITMDVKKNDVNAENCDVEIGDNTPEYGIVKVNSDNTVTYSLTDSSWNMDFFNYWLTYKGRKLSQATVKICIHRMPTPKANDDTYTCKRGTTIILEPTVNDENADNCRLEMKYELFKDFGTLIQSGNNFTFKHNADATRTTDFFTYKLINKSNSSIESNYARVTIDIEEPVKTPIANDDNYLVKMGDSITFDPTENDENAENCDIEIIKKLDTSYGTLTRNGNSFTFKDNADNDETFKIFTYRLVNKKDSSIKSEVAFVAFSIIEIPIAKDDEITLWHWKGKTASTRIKVMKNDLHTENCTIEEGGNEPNHGTIKIIKGFNEIEYTLTDVNATYDSFSYWLVKDGKMQTYATVKVHIKTRDEQIEKQKKEEKKEPECLVRTYVSGNPDEIHLQAYEGIYLIKVLLPDIIGKIYFHFDALDVPDRFIITYDPYDIDFQDTPYVNLKYEIRYVFTGYIERHKAADSYFVGNGLFTDSYTYISSDSFFTKKINDLYVFNSIDYKDSKFTEVSNIDRPIEYKPYNIVDPGYIRTAQTPCGFTINQYGKRNLQLNVSEKTYKRRREGALYCCEGNITLYIERLSQDYSKKAYIIVEAPEPDTAWHYNGMSVDGYYESGDCKPDSVLKITSTKRPIANDDLYICKRGNTIRFNPTENDQNTDNCRLEVVTSLYEDFGKLTQSGNNFTFKHNADATRTTDFFTYKLINKSNSSIESNYATIKINIEGPGKTLVEKTLVEKTLVEKTPTKKEIASFSTELGPPKSDCSCCHFLLNKKVEEDPNFIKKLEEILLLSDPVKSLYELLDKDIEFIEKLKKDPEFLKFNEIMTIEDFERPDDTIGPPVRIKEQFPMFSKCCTPDCFNSFVKMYKEEMKNKSDIKDENKNKPK